MRDFNITWGAYDKKADVLVLGRLSGITAGISSRQHYPDKKVVLVCKEGMVLIPWQYLSGLNSGG
jgi:hypothetical protein